MSDLHSWATRERLAPEVIEILQVQGFATVQDLHTLSPGDIKEYFQDTLLLNVAQCLALKKAISRLDSVTSSTPAFGSAPPVQQHPFVPSPNSDPPPFLAYPGHEQYSQPLGYPQHYTQPPRAPYATDPNRHQGGFPPYPTGRQVDGVTGEMRGMSLGMPQPGQWAASSFGHMQVTGKGEWFRFLLLGKTGSGKSTTGNTIFGEQLFQTAATFSSVTNDCERKVTHRGGRKIEIIDSPGLYDTHKTHEEICVTIVQAVAGMHPGPHAILYVVRMGRYTAEEYGAYQRLKALFDETISKYLIVVFTYGDMLEKEGSSIEDILRRQIPKELQQVLRDCNNRYIVFNNMASNSQLQVEKLFGMVREMVQAQGGQPYTCPKYNLIGKGMEEEVARRLHEVEKRDLKRQKYVQQLEQQTQQAEEAAMRSKEQFQKNDQERQRRLEAERRKRQELEEKLQTQIQQQEEQHQQQQQQLQQLHLEREQQEKRMRDKEHEMTLKEKQRAAEEAERMEQRERQMKAVMEEQQNIQKEENERQRQFLEEERTKLVQLMEEQRRKDSEELQRREEERERLWEKQRQEEAEAKRKRDEDYDKEMDKLKEEVVAKNEPNFFEKVLSTVASVAGVALKFLFKVP